MLSVSFYVCSLSARLLSESEGTSKTSLRVCVYVQKILYTRKRYDIIMEYYRLVTGDSPEAYEERPDWAKASKYNTI